MQRMINEHRLILTTGIYMQLYFVFTKEERVIWSRTASFLGGRMREDKCTPVRQVVNFQTKKLEVWA